MDLQAKSIHKSKTRRFKVFNHLGNGFQNEVAVALKIIYEKGLTVLEMDPF